MEKSTIRCNNRGEVRRIHIIYFLSRMGRVEHPHLIRLHHLNRNGVYLRDVKRWMADLRGKDIAETFSWSYKRRYKNVYVWQDILDDDLITPISDNEYVLKGSEIEAPPPIPSDGNVNCEKKVSISKNEKQVGVEVEIEEKEERSSQNSANHISPDNSFDSSTKTSSQICEEESPIFGSDISTLTEDSTKQQQSPTKHSSQGEQLHNFGSHPSSSSHSSVLIINNNKKDNKKKQGNVNKGYEGDRDDDDVKLCGYPELNSVKSKSYTNGASKMFRNFITCGTADTNDTALVSVNKASLSTHVNRSVVCKRDILGGSAREFATTRNQQQYTSARRSFEGVEGSKKNEQQQRSRFGNSKGVPAAYRPVGAPICSQCRKSFRPEKLHTHMKSCKGLKASATDSIKKPQPSTNFMAPLAAISFD